MFATQDILLFSVLAGVLASAVLWATWQWARPQRRFLIAGATTFVGMAAWNFTLNATQAVPNFDVVVGAAAIAGLVAIGLDLFVL